MGNSQSQALFWKLQNIIPDVNGNSHEGWWDKKAKLFASDKDREQFLYGVITVITKNGTLNLREHNFRLLYSRRDLGGGQERVVARIVAEKNNIIEAKLEPEIDGADHYEAFKALRKDVEIKLERILSEVPGDGEGLQANRAPSPGPFGAGGPFGGSGSGPFGSASKTPGMSARSPPSEAPPAYGSGDVKPTPGSGKKS